LSKRLLRWFAVRQSTKILNLICRHLDLVTGTVEELVRMLSAALKEDREEVEKCYVRIKDMEREADRLRRDLARELTKGVLPPEERDDLMHLIRRADWVADWAMEAGRLLRIVPVDKTSERFKKIIKEMCEEDLKCAMALKRCIGRLTENVKESLSLAYEVERIEEKIDDLYAELRAEYAHLEADTMNAGALVLLNMFMDAVEMIADWCENTSDYVRVIAVRLSE